MKRILFVACVLCAGATANSQELKKDECAMMYPILQNYALQMDNVIKAADKKFSLADEKFPANSRDEFRNAVAAYDKSRTVMTKALREHRNAVEDLARLFQLCAR
jgi:hypothetical protein